MLKWCLNNDLDEGHLYYYYNAVRLFACLYVDPYICYLYVYGADILCMTV